ncbi:hypothetical protein ACM39_05370 [Chryseobacterium sp. FH2]|nr:hypothetical protein ACM39_05370 [Chryseobacterium sp. FH2]
MFFVEWSDIKCRGFYIKSAFADAILAFLNIKSKMSPIRPSGKFPVNSTLICQLHHSPHCSAPHLPNILQLLGLLLQKFVQDLSHPIL